MKTIYMDCTLQLMATDNPEVIIPMNDETEDISPKRVGDIDYLCIETKPVITVKSKQEYDNNSPLKDGITCPN